MIHTCTKCQSETKVDVTFDYEQVVCTKCQKISNSNYVLKPPVFKSSIVLKLNQKGELFGIEYTVTGIVVKKHGSLFSWREYHLRGKNNEIAYLSESDGHWIFLKKCDEKVQYTGKVAIYKGDTYRWYADTKCNIIYAEGFFENSLNTRIHSAYEYILGTLILSSDDKEDFAGEHISKKLVKNAFGLSKTPSRSGVGLVQPYYFKLKDSAILLGLFLLSFIIIHFVVVLSRTNVKVFDGQINTFNNAFEDYVSNSFTLKGGVAPLYVDAQTDVNNNWVNLEIGLVNELTNEVLIANRDIEYYSGFEGGESWSEGSTKAKFNFCSIPQGTYHLVIRTDNGFILPEAQFSDSLLQFDNHISATLNANNEIIISDSRYTEIQTTTYNITDNVDDVFFIQAKNFFLSGDKQQAFLDIQKSNLKETVKANNVNMTVVWRPNNFWNLVVCSVVLIIIFVLIAWGKHLFERKKWSNSNNSPYSS